MMAALHFHFQNCRTFVQVSLKRLSEFFRAFLESNQLLVIAGKLRSSLAGISGATKFGCIQITAYGRVSGDSEVSRCSVYQAMVRPVQAHSRSKGIHEGLVERRVKTRGIAPLSDNVYIKAKHNVH